MRLVRVHIAVEMLIPKSYMFYEVLQSMTAVAPLTNYKPSELDLRSFSPVRLVVSPFDPIQPWILLHIKVYKQKKS